MRRNILSPSGFRLIGILAAISFSMLVYSCGSHQTAEVASTTGTGSVALSVKWEPPPASANLLPADERAVQPMAAIDICSAYGIDQVRLEVWRDGTPKSSTGIVATSACTDNSAALSGVPANIDNLYVQITCTPGDWSGESARFKLSPNEQKNLGEVTVQRNTAVAAPTFSLPPGTYATAQSVELASTTSGATIRYTTDGNMPSETEGTVYTGPISVSTSVTIRAIAYFPGGFISALSTGDYEITGTVAMPTFSPSPDTYTTAQSVILSTTTSGATIRYTTDATIPTETVGSVYSGPISVSSTMTIKAVAYKSGWSKSPVNSGTYEITLLQWHTPTRVDTSKTGDAYRPNVAMDRSGNAIAVWQHYDGTYYNIWANRFTPSDGWGTPTRIGSNSGSVTSLEIAMNGNGDALVMWSLSNHIYWNWYSPSGGWMYTTGGRLEADDAKDGEYASFALDDNGKAIAVWRQSGGTQDNIWAKHFTHSATIEWGTWGTTTPIGDNLGMATNPVISMNGNGDALVMWSQSNGTRYDIYWNRYLPSGGWETASRLETNDAGQEKYPLLKMDGSGNAIAVWLQSNYAWGSHFTPSGGWETAEPIPGDLSAAKLSLDMNSSGNAILMWSNSNDIYANHFTPSGGWGTATFIDNDVSGDFSLGSDVALDDSGNAIAVYSVADLDKAHVWANRYTSSSGWETPTKLEFGTTSSEFPSISMAGKGNAIAVWLQPATGVTGWDIWACRFD